MNASMLGGFGGGGGGGFLGGLFGGGNSQSSQPSPPQARVKGTSTVYEILYNPQTNTGSGSISSRSSPTVTSSPDFTSALGNIAKGLKDASGKIDPALWVVIGALAFIGVIVFFVSRK